MVPDICVVLTFVKSTDIFLLNHPNYPLQYPQTSDGVHPSILISCEKVALHNVAPTCERPAGLPKQLVNFPKDNTRGAYMEQSSSRNSSMIEEVQHTTPGVIHTRDPHLNT